MINQSQWIREYNDQHRPKFNQDLFSRNNYEIIEALKKVILSCQRHQYFTIEVRNFTVVEDYTAIHDMLYRHEQDKIDRNKNNSKKADNKYQFIDLKDSDIMLLVVDFFISVDNEVEKDEQMLRVILKIPRIVEKYYYRIGGNYFNAIYQIVDGSTYNNSSSRSKNQSVTFKTIFMPIRVYRNMYDETDYNGNEIHFTMYSSRIFSKNIPVMEYFFAKAGVVEALKFLGLEQITITDYYIGAPDTYTLFKNDIYVEAPKILVDNDPMTQCAVLSLHKYIMKGSTLEEVMGKRMWLNVLSSKFNSKVVLEKGDSVLESLESIYDIETYESLRLPEIDKQTIYHVIRWMCREFSNLRLKDNVDISTKKIRRPEYMAAMYAAKVSKGIYRASDAQRKIRAIDIARYIYVDPDFLTDKIVKDKLVGFRNNVNDNDAIPALKYSYKGVSGLGDQRGSTIPDSYRHLDASHLMRVDPDASSATDPGLTGMICPLAHIYNKSFSDYVEPNEWNREYSELLSQYKSTVGRKELVIFQTSLDSIFDITSNNKLIDMLDSCIESQKVALSIMTDVENSAEYDVNGGEYEYCGGNDEIG